MTFWKDKEIMLTYDTLAYMLCSMCIKTN